MRIIRTFCIFIFLVLTIIACKSKKLSYKNGNINRSETSVREEKNYFTYDTLLIEKYTSKSGNKIELRGSKSKDLYIIMIQAKNGKRYTYKIAANWYEAAHSYVVWDNSDYVFLRCGCGTGCWAGRVLNVTGEKEIRDFPSYVYTDSIKNYIVYPDTTDTKEEGLTLENLNTKQRVTVAFDLCEEAAIRMETIDTIYEVPGKKILVRYYDKGCKEKKEKFIYLN